MSRTQKEFVYFTSSRSDISSILAIFIDFWTLLGMRSFHRWCQLILYGRFQLIELDNDEVQQKFLANCFLNCLQIWRGRDWITVFCRVRHKKMASQRWNPAKSCFLIETFLYENKFYNHFEDLSEWISVTILLLV